MAAASDDKSTRWGGVESTWDWVHLYQRAAVALQQRFGRQGTLSPQETAETVAGTLPAALGRSLLAILARRGWLAADARLPFDVLEGSQCPAEFRGPSREVVRLALFGLPGQGRPSYKHREAAYQQICAQIMREASDLPTLSGAASRALSHPDVCGDPGLASLVRSFIAEREAALRTKLRVEHREPKDTSQLRTAFEEIGSAEFPTRHQLMTSFVRYQREFELHLAQYNEAACRYALEKIQELARRFPVHIDAAAVKHHEEQFAGFQERCAAMRAQVDTVARQAAAAARDGDQKTASWLIGRLRAIHALTPVLLSQERFEALRQEIDRSGRRHEHQEALSELVAREREVATELKRLGGVIYRFHKAGRQLSPTTPEYQRAEAAYREAVEQVRERDTEWLTGLLLELETYLEDLEDPTGRAQEKLDRFIGTVRSALNQLRLIIRTIQRERGAQQGGSAPSPPSASAGPPTG